MPLEFVRNDITKMQVDVIVNSVNPRAIVGGGVDRAIHKAAGPELLIARQKIGNIDTGEAFITPGYKFFVTICNTHRWTCMAGWKAWGTGAVGQLL